MNGSNQTQRLKDISLIAFVLLVSILYIFQFRIEIEASLELGETEAVTYWENPIRLLVTGAEPAHFEHPYRVFDGTTKASLLLGSILFLACIVGLVLKYLKKSERLLKFGVYAYLWIYTARLMVGLISMLNYGMGENASMYWSNFSWFNWILSVLPILLGFFALKTTKPLEEESNLPESGGPLRLVHGAIDILLMFVGIEYFLRIPKYVLQYSFSSSRSYMPDDSFIIQFIQTGTITFIASLFLVYLFFNRFLGITPGKLITNSINSSPRNWKSSATNAVGRLIPFEPFSVLGKSMWHDKISGVKVWYTGDHPQVVKLASYLKTALRVLVVILLWSILWGVYSLLTDSRIDEDHFFLYIYLIYFSVLMIQVTFIATLGELYRQTNESAKWNKGLLLGYIGLIPLLGIAALNSIQTTIHKHLETTLPDRYFTSYFKFKDHLQNMVTQVSLGLMLIGIVWLITSLLEMSPNETRSILGLGSLIGTILSLSGMANLSKGVRKYWIDVIGHGTEEIVETTPAD